MSEQKNKVQHTIPVVGMTCTGCARTLEVEFRKFANIDFSVNFSAANIAVTYDPDQYDRADFVRAIEAHGYKAGGE